MRQNSERWHVVSESEFVHEREGLGHVRDLLPDRGPFHAWSNFEFRDHQGRWAEVDLLVLGEGRLHLVELKHYQGPISGNAYRWQRGQRSEDSPLLVARRKAQRLASVLKDAARRIGMDPSAVPFVQESIFLHADNTQCLLTESDKTDLFGLDGYEDASNLPSIADRLLEPDRRRHDRPGLTEDAFLEVVEAAGFAVRREREVGSWRIIGAPLNEGDGWQDWPAEHRVAREQRARIRFFLVADGSSAAQVEARRQLVSREFSLTSRLRHDGVLSPRDLVDHELGAGLVFPYDPDGQRLDLWLADRAPDLSHADQVDLVRQLAEALQYAHSNGIVHRGLNPMAITVHGSQRDGSQLKVGNWQVAGAVDDATNSILETQGTATRVFGLLDRDRSDRGERFADSFVAPEGQWSPHAHRVKLDVFALGAVAYLLVSNQVPATSAVDLKERLARDGGLDLAADLPEAPAPLRELIRDATRPQVSQRLRDVPAFLEGLSHVERALSAGETNVDVDPLDAAPGTFLGDRFELVRRLGSGSTAVGLLVIDHQANEAQRVLKVAVDDAAGQRIYDEAEVLSALRGKKHPRLVRLVEKSPLEVGGRTALLLASAGEKTLGDELRDRRRLSLDLLDRWGTDLLEALVGLDEAGVDHRDIKPANLGVREQRSDRAKHLVLFDFSLARASAATVKAGTPPYLDPFLGTGSRSHWDSAAERYAVAVTLFEMATGNTPVYGDGQSDPGSIREPATIEAAAFDPTAADGLVAFFTRALDRDAKQRFGTAAEMLAAWRSALSATTTTTPDDADELAQQATPGTSLSQSGLTPRALSALEPFRLETVGDLAALDTGKLSRFSGIVDATKREIRTRAKQWRERFGDSLPVAGADEDQETVRPDDPLVAPVATAKLLVESAGSERAAARRTGAEVLLGLSGRAPAFGTLGELAGPLELGGSPQVSQLLAAIRDGWTANATATSILDDIADQVLVTLDGLDGAAWAETVVNSMAPAEAVERDRRVIAGLVRAALDRTDDKAKGADEESPIARRRRRSDSRLILAVRPSLAAVAGPLGEVADQLVTEARDVGDAVLSRGRAAAVLRAHWTGDLLNLDDVRLVRLAARMSDSAAASTSGELYSREMPSADAVRLALGATIPSQEFTVADVHKIVQVRFPGVADLPRRPDLDDVLRQAGTGLEWTGNGYAVPSSHSDTTFVTKTHHTTIPVGRADGKQPERLVRELRESVGARSFLAIGIPARQVERTTSDLLSTYGGVQVNVTDLLLGGLRSQAEEKSVPWDAVLAADAAESGTRAADGLAALVRQSISTIETAIAEAMESASEATQPVVVTDAAPLARYGHLRVIARLADVAQHRSNAVWLIVPQGPEPGAHLDGTPIPLSYSSQFLNLDNRVAVPAAAEGETQ
ncbi:BREX system serine/threonine kinase PglW [Garicola koreensis]|uniref:Serine/threonine protein kinase n=1 Tax=Garicola koreensis TaxID=1262554 RepID=A0A7W5TNJ0_9MICC|nr:BREX system serine/threonine kinase PglW [Garicola koreensis]MBB3666671.1 serine/threonine protein kinase [Garicola koreensis]